MASEEGTIEFWIRGVDIQKLKEDEDHYFVVTWGKTKEDIVCYIDTKKVTLTHDFRLSKTTRTEAYIKATYKSIRGKLLKYGTEETRQ